MAAKFTLDDFIKRLATDDFLGDRNYEAGSLTWIDPVCEDFGASAGGLVKAAVDAGLIEHANDETFELTIVGAERIAAFRDSNR